MSNESEYIVQVMAISIAHVHMYIILLYLQMFIIFYMQPYVNRNSFKYNTILN